MARGLKTLLHGLMMSLAAVAGCSSTANNATPDGGDTSDSGGLVPQAAYVDRVVAAYCGGLATCCGSRGFAFSPPLCDAFLRPAIETCPDGTVYDARAAGDCVSATQTGYGACLEAHPAACEKVCVGTRGAGEPCTTDEQCAATAIGAPFCVWGSGGSATGYCSVPVAVKQGDPCLETCSGTGEDAGCLSNLTDFLTNSPAQRPACLKAEGAACTSGECVDGAHCVDSRCQAPVPIGGACTLPGVCVDGAYCTVDNVCAARKADGEPCGGPTETMYECISNQCIYDGWDQSTGPMLPPADGGPMPPGVCGQSTYAIRLNITAATCGGNFMSL